MSKVQLAGNANGTGIFTIASPNSNTDRTLTLPDNTGTLLTNASVLSKANLPTGSVLQVVSVNKTDTFSTSATSYTDLTGMSASITPNFSTSKILVLVSMVAGSSAYSALAAVRLMRDATAIDVGNAASGFTQGTVGNQRSSYDGNSAWNISINYLDSPATTSSITYKLQGFIESGTLRINTTGNDQSGAIWSVKSASTITLLEIAG